MPQLKSGRHVGVAPSSLLDELASNDDQRVRALILLYRLTVKSASDLLLTLPVVYFANTEVFDPRSAYPSNFSVENVLAGEDGWSSEEIAEFRLWLAENDNFQNWLNEYFREVDTAVRTSRTWRDDGQDLD